MHSLADSIETAAEHLEQKTYTSEQWKAFDFIRSHTGRIEIVWDGNLQRVYFPIRPVCHYMSAGARKNLILNVDRESQATKVMGLMVSVPDLIDEMNHNEELDKAILKITPQRLTFLKDFSTYVGLVINLIFLVFSERKYHYRDIDI